MLERRLSASGIEFDCPSVEIFVNKTTGDFVAVPASAATSKNRIELQPVSLLKQRGILETTLRHELVHVVVDAVVNKRRIGLLKDSLLRFASKAKISCGNGWRSEAMM